MGILVESRMARLLASLFTALLILWPASRAPAAPQVDLRVKEALKTYVRSHYMTQEDYVLSKFKDHDVVFLGENHHYKHDPELVEHRTQLAAFHRPQRPL